MAARGVTRVRVGNRSEASAVSPIHADHGDANLRAALADPFECLERQLRRHAPTNPPRRGKQERKSKAETVPATGLA